MATTLIDSNLLIYSIRAEYRDVRRFILSRSCAASAISLVELLGYPDISADDIADYQQIFRGMEVLGVTARIIDEAILIRQRRKMSLGDSIIAATSTSLGLTLATNNEKDFRWIPEIRLINPLKPERP